MVHGSRDNNHSSTYPRAAEHLSRLHVKASLEPDRLDAHKSAVGAFRHRSVCHQTNETTARVLQQEARSRVDRSRCTGSRLAPYERVCTPSMVPHRSSAPEGLGTGGHSDTDCPSTAQ